MGDEHGTDRAEATRRRLMDAATAAFAEKGFNGTSTRDIAAAAEMSPAALYVHHKSKEELLYLISRAGHEDTLHAVRAATAEPDPAVALRTAVHDFAMQHATMRTRARIVNYELGALTPEHYAEIRALRRDIEREVRALVARGVQDGAFRTPDPDLAAVALLSLGIDIARWYRPHGRWEPERIADGYADIALRIVGADG